MAASPSPVTNQWMQILWNPDFDFAVQVIDSQLFATVISLITTTVALSRHFKCQNRNFFLIEFYIMAAFRHDRHPVQVTLL